MWTFDEGLERVLSFVILINDEQAPNWLSVTHVCHEPKLKKRKKLYTYKKEIIVKKVILTKLFSIVHVEKRLGNKNTASSMTAARMTAGIRADRNVRINVRHAWLKNNYYYCSLKSFIHETLVDTKGQIIFSSSIRFGNGFILEK